MIHRRKFINFNSLYLCRKYFFDKFRDNNIKLHTLIGNHDVAFKNTLEVNSTSLLLQEYENVIIYDEFDTVSFDGVDIDVVPWLCHDNQDEIFTQIKNSKNQICFGHFEIDGFEMDRGNICHGGIDRKSLIKYDMVLTGHFHHKSDDGHIYYVGTPGEMTWADFDDERGFHIFDTETRELTFIPNPHRMFYKIRYNDEEMFYNDISEQDYSIYTGKYVKVVVEKRTNTFLFDTLMDLLSKANTSDVSVVEDFSDITTTSDIEIIDQAQDTISILNTYVDSLTLPVESDKIKTILRDVYNEAIALETA